MVVIIHLLSFPLTLHGPVRPPACPRTTRSLRLRSPVHRIILGWQESKCDLHLQMRERRRGRGEGRQRGGGDEPDNEIDAMRKGCRRPNEMISDVKEKEDELMRRNCVNSIWMEVESTAKASVASSGCFSICSLSPSRVQMLHSLLPA